MQQFCLNFPYKFGRLIVSANANDHQKCLMGVMRVFRIEYMRFVCCLLDTRALSYECRFFYVHFEYSLLRFMGLISFDIVRLSMGQWTLSVNSLLPRTFTSTIHSTINFSDIPFPYKFHIKNLDINYFFFLLLNLSRLIKSQQ